MRQQTRPLKEPAEKVGQDIRRATRKHYSAEKKIRIVLESLRGEDSIAEPCRWRSLLRWRGQQSEPHRSRHSRILAHPQTKSPSSADL